MYTCILHVYMYTCSTVLYSLHTCNYQHVLRTLQNKDTTTITSGTPKIALVYKPTSETRTLLQSGHFDMDMSMVSTLERSTYTTHATTLTLLHLSHMSKIYAHMLL